MQVYSKINGNGYSITDNFNDNDLLNSLIENNSLSKIKKLYDLFNKEWDEEFYIMTEQPVSLENEAFSNDFVYGYGDLNDDEMNPKLVKCIQMNAAAIKGSNLNVIEGRAFYKNEYTINDMIPLIVGYNYLNYLKINDTFSIKYLQRTLNVKVVGILSEGACAAKSDDTILDNSIILPALESPDEPTDEVDVYFQLKLYLGHTNSFIYSNKSVLLVQKELNDICKSVNIEPYNLMGVRKINLFGLGIARSNYFLLLIMIFVFVLIICFLSHIYWKKIFLLYRIQLVKKVL